MASFDIDLSHPFPSGFTGGLGGPNQGGHQPPNWYIQFGMDLGADEGTQILAAFDAHITKLVPHDPDADTQKVYGAQLFMRAPNDMMGGFYTHLTDVPPELAVDSTVSRGDPLGTVLRFDPTPPHLHLALVEIIGGAPGGTYQGVDLYKLFLDTGNTDTVTTVTFMQDGSPPVVD
ncbi:peptidoglycan DD-metalloendopeptidase family protein [Streptomyces sp. NPDC006743]|uniref:peptidoglycan DD-metalloendopeptidase family protein n=1 Tax=Streptomyces sp. NPDC006743 TaxID=3154480 RepID=UPI003456BEB3